MAKSRKFSMNAKSLAHFRGIDSRVSAFRVSPAGVATVHDRAGNQLAKIGRAKRDPGQSYATVTPPRGYDYEQATQLPGQRKKKKP